MGRDTYKRHHSVQDRTFFDFDKEKQIDTSSTYPFITDENQTSWIDQNSTSSTNSEEEKTIAKGDISTLPGFASRFLSGDLSLNPKYLIIFILGCYIVLVCALYLQDNGLSKLDNLAGIMTFGMKLLPISGLLLLIIIIVGIFTCLSTAKKKKSKP